MNRMETRAGTERGRLRAHSTLRAATTADITLRSRLRRYAAADMATLDARLGELEREWDLGRVLEASAGVIGLMSLGLGAARSVTSTLLPAALFTILLQFAFQGWSPPVSLLRALGYRSRKEIEKETYGLKLLRGDFQGVPSLADAAPETRAFRAWEAIKETCDTHAAPIHTRASRWAPFRIKDRSASARILLHSKPEHHTRRGTPPVIPTDIRAENFLAHMRSKWTPENEADLDSALRAVLAHLKWRLAPAEAEPLFAHLPRSIAKVAETELPHGYALGNPPKGMIDAGAFYDEIALETGLSRGEVQQATSAIFSSMKRQLPASQNRAMRAMLPKELKRVWASA